MAEAMLGGKAGLGKQPEDRSAAAAVSQEELLQGKKGAEMQQDSGSSHS